MFVSLAAGWQGRPEEGVTPGERAAAKQLAYAILYGMVRRWGCGWVGGAGVFVLFFVSFCIIRFF